MDSKAPLSTKFSDSWDFQSIMKLYVVCTFLQPILKRVHIYIVLLHCSWGFPFGNSPAMYNHHICFTDVEIEARSLLKVPPLVRCGLRIGQSGLGSELTACHALCTMPCCSCFVSRGSKGQSVLWRLTLDAYRREVMELEGSSIWVSSSLSFCSVSYWCVNCSWGGRVSSWHSDT